MSTTLVTVAELQQHLFDADWCVVDCRHELSNVAAGRQHYERGRIPGAVFADIDHDLSGGKTGSNGRHPLPTREALAALFSSWGVGPQTQLVAYDAGGGPFAARLWWLARWLGHARVAVLDGGWQAWTAATDWSSTEQPARLPSRFVAGASLVPAVDAAQVLAMLGRADQAIVDARAAERYEGRVEPIDPVAGHVPGALNRPWQENLEQGCFKSPEALRREFEQLLGRRPMSDVTVLCGSGVTACHHLLALEHAGLSGARLYPGSWSEWVADPSRPVATGAAP